MNLKDIEINDENLKNLMLSNNLDGIEDTFLYLLDYETKKNKIPFPQLDETKQCIFDGFKHIAPIKDNYLKISDEDISNEMDFLNIDNKIICLGDFSYEKAGEKTVIFSIINPNKYVWEDETTDDIVLTYSVEKGDQPGYFSKTELNFYYDLQSLEVKPINFKCCDGLNSFLLTIEDENVIDIISDFDTETFIITPKISGNTEIKIFYIPEEENTYNEKEFVINVVSTLADPILNNNNPKTISEVAKAGLAQNYWNIGDKIKILINGDLGPININSNYYAYILDFSRGESKKDIHFQIGKSIDENIEISFYGPTYNSVQEGAYFVLNQTATNLGGWKDSHARNIVMPIFLSIFPQEWQDVIIPWKIYTDNIGGTGDSISSITETEDKLFLPSESEVFYPVDCTRANTNEKNFCKQYAYYENGNSRIRYKYDNPSDICMTWMRSPHNQNDTGFCYILPGGGSFRANSNFSLGFAPCFVVGEKI